MSSKVTLFIDEAEMYKGIRISDHATAKEGTDKDGNGHRICAILSSFMGLMETAAEREAVCFMLKSINPANSLLPPQELEMELPSRTLFWVSSTFMSRLCETVYFSLQAIKAEYPGHFDIEVVRMSRKGKEMTTDNIPS